MPLSKADYYPGPHDKGNKLISFFGTRARDGTLTLFIVFALMFFLGSLTSSWFEINTVEKRSYLEGDFGGYIKEEIKKEDNQI